MRAQDAENIAVPADFRDDFLDVLIFRNVPESLPSGLSRLDLAEALARIVVAHTEGMGDGDEG